MGGNEKKSTTRKELKEQIIKKAQSDKDFKEVLVNDPKEAIRRLGVQLPAEIEVKVVEESPEVVYLVLPVEPGGLTDDQLGDVAGGAGRNSESVPICGSRWVE